MKLFLLVALTMTAFAGNSILNRYGVGILGMDPVNFAAVRTIAGAVMLAVLAASRGNGIAFGRPQVAGGIALTIYMLGFSWAYLTLDAGLGALILFGVLQVAMFGFAVLRGQFVPALRWVGASLAMLGLVVLLWPSGTSMVPFAGSVAMILAGLAWAVYTILGQGVQNAVAASAGNFILSVPFVGFAALVGFAPEINVLGAGVAVLAGAVTSGLGYALWYRVLPQLPTTIAATAQLSVPVIAVLGGALFLAEPVTLRLILAGGLVLGGIGLSLRA